MRKARSLVAWLLTLCLVTGAAFGIPGALEAKATGSDGLLLDVDFSTGTASNMVGNGPQLIAGTGSTVTYAPDTTLGKKVAVFDTKSGFGYQLNDAFYETLENGFTIEVLVRMDGNNAGQAVVGNDTGAAGFSIYNPTGGTNTGLHFWQRTTDANSPRMVWSGTDRTDRPADGEWTHLMYSINYSGTSRCYVNGKDGGDYLSGIGDRLKPTGDAQVLYIGGNPDASGGFTDGLLGCIGYVKIHSSAVDAAEAAETYQSAMNGAPALLSIDYSLETAKSDSQAGVALVEGSGETVEYVDDETLGRKVARFDSESGFGYRLTDEVYEAMKQGYTLEVLCKLSELPNVTNTYGSAIVGSMNDGVGFGFMGTVDNYLDYWIAQENSGGNYRQLYYQGHGSTVPTDIWQHLVVTCADGYTMGDQFHYYVNGVKCDYVAPSSMAFLTDPANILYVGGSTDGAGSFRTGMKGDVAYVNMYSGSKSADEIQTLYNNAMTKGTTKAEIKTDPVDPVDPVDPDESADFNENNIVSRYAVMSDTHVRKTTDHTSNRLFENALKAAKTLTGGDLDAILLAGDLIEGYDEPEAEVSRVKELLEANLDSAKTEFVVATGNHDYYFLPGINRTTSWADFLGDDFLYQNPAEGNTDDEVMRSNYHTVRNGIHIITVFGYDGNHQAADVAWLEQQLAAAANDTPDMPILVISHVQAAGSLTNDEPDADDDTSRWVSTTIVPVLEKYPQVVYMAGHTHATPQVKRYNDTFMAVGTGSLQDKKNMMILEVDGNGNVRIRNYAISADNAETGDPLFETTFATPVAQATAPDDSTLAQATVPEADILDVDFAGGTAKDNVNNTPFEAAGQTPSIADNDAMDKNAADFNGTDTALVYQLSQNQFAAMADGVTMELTVLLKEKPASGETVLFGNKDFSLCYNSDGKLVFYAGVAKLTSEEVDTGKWIHVSIAWTGSDLRMYVDGLRADKSRAGALSPTTTAIALGGIAEGDGAESLTAMTVGNFRIYGTALDSTQAYALASRSLNTRMIFADDAVFRVVRGTSYTIPMPAASDANNDVLEVSVSGLDKYGNALVIRDGCFTPYNTGECTLTYRVNGLLVTKTVEVVKAGEASATIVLDAAEKTIAAGGSVTLEATVSVEGEAIVWTSSDPSVASVDSNGEVTGIKAGTAVITATLDNGQSAACTVTVTADGGKTDESGGNPPATGETAPWAFGLAVLSLSAAALISARKRTA